MNHTKARDFKCVRLSFCMLNTSLWIIINFFYIFEKILIGFLKNIIVMSKLDDLIDRITWWKSTGVGIAMAVVTILVGFGIVGEEAKEGAEVAVGGFWEGVVLTLTGLSSIIGLFSKKGEPVV